MAKLTFFWFLPFLCFFAGYYTVRSIFHKKVVAVPSIIGLHITDAIKLLSNQNLNTRVLDQKYDVDMPEGIVISQSPQADYKLKEGQSIFLVITKQPDKLRAPDLFTLSKDQSDQLALKLGLNLKSYFLKPNYSQNSQTYKKAICIAQQFQPNQELDSKKMSAYFSADRTNIRIMPDIKNHSVQELKKHFKDLYSVDNNYNIELIISNSNDQNLDSKDLKVKEQRPIAGSIIDLKKLKKIYVSVYI